MQRLLEISRSEKVAVDAARTNRELAQWFASLDQDEATHRAAIKATLQQLDLDVPLLLANGSRNLSFAPEGVERQVWNELGGEEGDAAPLRLGLEEMIGSSKATNATVGPRVFPNGHFPGVSSNFTGADAETKDAESVAAADRARVAALARNQSVPLVGGAARGPRGASVPGCVCARARVLVRSRSVRVRGREGGARRTGR